MKKPIVATLLGWLLMMSLVVSGAAPRAFAQEKKEAPPPPTLKVGDTAPDFTLKYFDGNDLKDITLHEFKGKKNVVVAFFVFAFTSG